MRGVAACDGAWPQAWVDLFGHSTESGKPRRPSPGRAAAAVDPGKRSAAVGAGGANPRDAARGAGLQGAAQIADAELVEGELEDRVRVHRVLYTVPEHMERVMSLRDRAIARREVDRGGEGGVAVRLVLVVV